MWKASLHGDDSWRFALTSENERSESPMLAGGHHNTPWEFTPTPFVDGVRLAFVIAVVRGALMDESPDSKETVVEVEDRWDRLTGLYVRMTEPNVTLDPRHAVVGGPLPLTSGRQVWVTTCWEAIEPIAPEPLPVSTIVEPMSPEKHGVKVPCFRIRGVHLEESGNA
jgi:hypothetical protein